MDPRVTLLVGLVLASCSPPNEDLVERSLCAQGCPNSNLDIRILRDGKPEDCSVWELTIRTPEGDVACFADRGGWLCTSPSFRGVGHATSGPESISFAYGRGLPQESKIEAFRPPGEPFTAWTFSVRKNGAVVVDAQSPACSGGRCTDGGQCQTATLLIPATSGLP